MAYDPVHRLDLILNARIRQAPTDQETAYWLFVKQRAKRLLAWAATSADVDRLARGMVRVLRPGRRTGRRRRLVA
jgi:hypothetical protein